MTSKLFHTVVGVGISLGAMSIGCAAEPGSDSSESAAADTTTSTDETQPASYEQDRYCNVAWPTTKRGGGVAQAQACIDPKHECGAYPDGASFSRDWCTPVNTDGTCVADAQKQVWQICKDTKSSGSPEWECPSGTILTASCPAPSDTSTTSTTASTEAQN